MPKKAANEVEELEFDECQPLSFTEIKKEIRNDTIANWQRQWDRNEQSSLLCNIKPNVSLSSIHSSLISNVDKRFNRLTTGHSNLKEQRWRMSMPDTNSPACSCGEDSGTVEHFLLFCPKFSKQRKTMINSIIKSYNEADIPPADRCTDIPLILGLNEQLPKSIRINIRTAVYDFIYSTSSDIMI